MPIIQKITKAGKELPIELARYLRRQYPAFVTRNLAELPTNDVPVFMFHTVEGDAFESQLAYLKHNGYHTLDADELYRFLQGQRTLDKPSVALTFDDGDVSWHQVAQPLLEKYDYRAIGFIAPHYVAEDTPKTQGKAWMSWSQINELHRSGHWDIQSHTHYHDHIFTGSQLVDIHDPSRVANPLGLDTPWIYQEGGEYSNELPKGHPIYAYSSRFESKPMYLPNASFLDDCIQKANSTAATSSNSRDFKKTLKLFHNQQVKLHKAGRYETQEEQHQRILLNLRTAKETLENQLGHEVQHLCYPWGIGSDLSVQISKEAGYISNYWGSVRGRNQNKTGDSPYHICRLKDDYLLRLPGEGRKSLLDIFKAKAKRRSQTLDIY